MNICLCCQFSAHLENGAEKHGSPLHLQRPSSSPGLAITFTPSVSISSPLANSEHVMKILKNNDIMCYTQHTLTHTYSHSHTHSYKDTDAEDYKNQQSPIVNNHRTSQHVELLVKCFQSPSPCPPIRPGVTSPPCSQVRTPSPPHPQPHLPFTSSKTCLCVAGLARAKLVAISLASRGEREERESLHKRGKQ